jgi:hypothetical protein
MGCNGAPARVQCKPCKCRKNAGLPIDRPKRKWWPFNSLRKGGCESCGVWGRDRRSRTHPNRGFVRVAVTGGECVDGTGRISTEVETAMEYESRTIGLAMPGHHQPAVVDRKSVEGYVHLMAKPLPTSTIYCPSQAIKPPTGTTYSHPSRRDMRMVPAGMIAPRPMPWRWSKSTFTCSE